ncbi:unnamed protein product [Brassica oleracea]
MSDSWTVQSITRCGLALLSLKLLLLNIKVKETKKKLLLKPKKDCIRRARAIFERANAYYKDYAHKEERATLLEDWANMEAGFGSFGDVSVVQSLLPKKLKKRKAISREDGSTEYQEYTDYLFPDESLTTANLKILEAAHRWKKQEAGECV